MTRTLSSDAATVAALLAVDPVGLGGVALRGPAGCERDDWLSLLRQLLPTGTALRRVPLNISDAALLGGLDLGATLHAGQPVGRQGLLADADGGLLVLAMAERMAAGAAARFCAVLDMQELVLERDGLTRRTPARLGVVALDEGATAEEQLPASLLERMAFRVVLADGHDRTHTDASTHPDPLYWTAQDIARARTKLPQVSASDAAVQALCAAALALGADSLRASLFALRAARVAAALADCTTVEDEHVALAARLVIAPRATRLPAPPQQVDPSEEDPSPEEAPQSEPPASPDEAPAPVPPPEPSTSGTKAQASAGDPDQQPAPALQALEERVIDAAQAAIPLGLLAALKLAETIRSKAPSAGRSGAVQKSQLRGRPIGARRGEPRAGQRLNLIETLRAAAPWQALRQAGRAQQLSASDGAAPAAPRIQVRKEDFHVSRFRQRGQTTTVFVVDASGSAALHRLAEAKGAVELLLADCYVRRDSVAVLAFRGKTAELLLPVTRSLARAKRSLAGLPGGGGTPLASGIDAARALGEQIRRKGETPVIVLLTDGRGNIARDGTPGRTQAALDASAAARQLRAAGLTALLLDTSAQPQPVAQALAADMGARYVALPYAGAQGLSQAVRVVVGGAARAQ